MSRNLLAFAAPMLLAAAAARALALQSPGGAPPDAAGHARAALLALLVLALGAALIHQVRARLGTRTRRHGPGRRELLASPTRVA